MNRGAELLQPTAKDVAGTLENAIRVGNRGIFAILWRTVRL